MGHMNYSHVFLERVGASDAYELYSTHIDETDVALDGVRQFSSAVADIMQRDKPGLLFPLPLTVLEIIGTDLLTLCRELQPDHLDMHLLLSGCGGFDMSQYQGIRKVFTLLSGTSPVDVERAVWPSLSTIGLCADLFRFQVDATEIVRIVEGALGVKPLCVMTSGASAARIGRMGGANASLVIRREGLPTAERLQKRFDTPYLLAQPYGVQGTYEWTGRVSRIMGVSPDRSFVEGEWEETLRLISPVLPMS